MIIQKFLTFLVILILFSGNAFTENADRKNRDINLNGLIEIPTARIAGNQIFRWITNIIGFQNKDPLIFMTYGQSNSVNQSEKGYETVEDVYMFLDGRTYKYQDPALGGTGGNGSVWGRVGDQLIQNNITNKVVFVNTGWSGASIHNLTYNHQYVFFEEQLKSVLETFGRIDGILFHQGETNHQRQSGSDGYNNDFLTLLTNIRKLTDAPVYLSQVSLCQSKSDKTLLQIQDTLIKKNKGIFRGPNSDILSDPKFRLPDYCHFSLEGLDELSKMWFESIVNKSEI